MRKQLDDATWEAVRLMRNCLSCMERESHGKIRGPRYQEEYSRALGMLENAIEQMFYTPQL